MANTPADAARAAARLRDGLRNRVQRTGRLGLTSFSPRPLLFASPEAPPPDPDAWGACPPLPSALDQYSADRKAGIGQAQAIAYLAADADSDLARQLASYGKAMHGKVRKRMRLGD